MFVGFTYADIEDFFTKEEYLKLYNGTFGTQIKEEELDSSKGIMSQLKHINGNKPFNHYSPAKYMMEHMADLTFSSVTLEHFEKVFQTINKLLK